MSLPKFEGDDGFCLEVLFFMLSLSNPCLAAVCKQPMERPPGKVAKTVIATQASLEAESPTSTPFR